MQVRTVSRWLLASTFAIAAFGTNALSNPLGGAVPADKPFTLNVTQVAATRGQPATARVVFRAGTGYHVNKDFPTELRLKLPDGISAPKSTFSKTDAKLSEEEGRFDVVLVANAAGKQTVLGELRFAVCTATTCDPQRTSVAIEMNVK